MRIRTAGFTSMTATPVPANDKGSGDFTAIPGAGAGNWGVSGQTGSFTWSYPFSARQAPAGPSPALSLGYDSSSVDGLTSSTNNQASVVGDGWSLAGLGSIRQNFAPCMDQGVTGTYDLCGSPAGQQFSISFGGRAGQIIKDAATGTYRLQNDDNTKIEYLTVAGTNGTYDGGHWKITDTSGTQYFFGLNKLPGWSSGQATTNSTDTVPVGAASSTQPCYVVSFASSLCQQAYAWNLDYVVDTHGNSQAVYYAQDTNYYAAQAGDGARLSYVRASRPERVDYGMRSGSELTASAPLQISFGYTGRCTGVDCTQGNDMPTGFACAATGACTVYSPTFYADQRLQTVTSRTLVSGVYQTADIWTLGHSMPDPGDGTKPALWLGTIGHRGANTTTGTGAVITDPNIIFSGETLQNRVWVIDGLAPLDRYRLSSIKTATGAVISVGYMAPECTSTTLPASPETNTKRCFPQWWAPTTPVAQPAQMDYFHIYPVASVGISAGPGSLDSPDLLTRYTYLGTPAWKYAAPKFVAGSGGSRLSWSVLAGWSQVKTITGNAAAGLNPTTTTTYLRGLDGTTSNSTGGTRSSNVTASNGSVITDSPWLAGATIESQSFLGETGPRLSSTVTVPWASSPTATGSAGTDTAQARHTGTKSVTRYIASSQGTGTRTKTVTNYFDKYGRISSSSATPETGSGTTGSCTMTDYADNPAANILALQATVTTHSGECSTDGVSTAAILTAARTLYDTSTSAVPGSSGYSQPVDGNPTRTDTATAVSGNNVTTWQQGPALVYDALGRAISSTDNTTGTARTTTTAFTPATGLPATVTTTNPLGWTSTQTLDMVRGLSLSEVDENGNTTTRQYDASGRPTALWDPLRPQTSNPTPTQGITYSVSQTAPSWVHTGTINTANQVVSSYTIYDGLGRIRQTQNMSPGGGTIASDTYYDSAGAVRRVDNDYFMSPEPNGTLLVPTVAVPSSTTYAFDGAGRTTAITAVANDNQTLWTTNIAYIGQDTATTTGPGNESAKRVITNADGNVTSQLLYHGTTASGVPDTTTYRYDTLGQLTGMTDTAGNAWSWTFDPGGRTISATDPDTGTHSTSYDSSGRVSSVTDATNSIIAYSYDILDRKTTTTVSPAGGQPHTLSTSTYDGEKKGQLSSTTRYNGSNYDQAVTTAVSGYNAAYQPKTVTTTLPAGLGAFAGPYTTTTYFTKTGKPSQKAFPAMGGLPAETLYYGYDTFQNDSSLANGTGDTLAGNTQYNHLNLISTFQQWDANSSSTTTPTVGLNQSYFTWDATTGRLTNHWSTNKAKNNTADLGKTAYTYTPSGKLTARSVAFAGRTGTPTDYQCYSYDYAARLAAVWTPSSKTCTTAPSPASTSVTGLGGPAPYAHTYTYTQAGDRSQVKRFSATGALSSTESYTYAAVGQPGPHRLKSLTTTPAGGTATTVDFSWDSGGRMTGRAGQTLNYTLDGLLASSSGSALLPTNPNPSATAGTPPAPATGTAGSASSRYYDAAGNLVGIVDGSGTTITLGKTTAHATTTGAKSATRSYDFLGNVIAERIASGTTVRLAFVVSDSVNTAQTILQPTTTTAGSTAITRYTDPFGLARGATQSATGTGAYATAPATVKGTGSNTANLAGFSASNGYIAGLGDTVSSLTHLGARDLDPVTGAFTTPDPVLKPSEARNFSAYIYSEGDPVNGSDPSGLIMMPALSEGGSWHGVGAKVTPGRWVPRPVTAEYLNPFRPLQTYARGTYVNGAYAGFHHYSTPMRYSTTDVPAPTFKGPMSLKQTLNAMQGNSEPEDQSWEHALGPVAAVAAMAFGGRSASAAEGAVVLGARGPTVAEAAAAEGTVAAAKSERVAINGETAATKLGRDMHKAWNYGPGYEKEFTLRAGGRVDAINFETRHIFELKPNNPRAIRLGERQIEGYVAKLNEQFPGKPWTGSVVTYGP
ncbi:RHS repeat-associated core domain-containing protein [Arthrobacter sp. NPDC056727]|uniref:RHS repeat-associated core domain-containing protein n=1 Tax=Arthrobacter sp. NPDC056727 TaxID=3345927 RepID=UPI00366E5D1D